jgi:AcrR family transcriptional regulator
MDGFERRKEQSKEEIRRAAEELFSKFGADKVSVNDIARRAGVSQATIYNNFGSKENLVHDYRKGIVGAVAGRFREIMVWKKSWLDKFQGLFQYWIDFSDRYKIEIEGREAGPAPGEMLTEIESTFLEFIREGKAQGSLRTDVSDEAVTTYIRLFRQGIAGNPALHERMHRDAKFSGDLISLFIYGLNGQKK